jgi:hypothetical protein
MEVSMNLKSIQINLALGQDILVGHKQEKATITKIEQFEKSGDVVINTTRGTRKVLTFKLLPHSQTNNVADRYR